MDYQLTNGYSDFWSLIALIAPGNTFRRAFISPFLPPQNASYLLCQLLAPLRPSTPAPPRTDAATFLSPCLQRVATTRTNKYERACATRCPCIKGHHVAVSRLQLVHCVTLTNRVLRLAPVVSNSLNASSVPPCLPCSIVRRFLDGVSPVRNLCDAVV